MRNIGGYAIMKAIDVKRRLMEDDKQYNEINKKIELMFSTATSAECIWFGEMLPETKKKLKADGWEVEKLKRRKGDMMQAWSISCINAQDAEGECSK